MLDCIWLRSATGLRHEIGRSGETLACALVAVVLVIVMVFAILYGSLLRGMDRAAGEYSKGDPEAALKQYDAVEQRVRSLGAIRLGGTAPNWRVEERVRKMGSGLRRSAVIARLRPALTYLIVPEMIGVTNFNQNKATVERHEGAFSQIGTHRRARFCPGARAPAARSGRPGASCIR